MNKYIIALTGASGHIYADLLIKTLLEKGHTLHLLATECGKKVYEYELDKRFESAIKDYNEIAAANQGLLLLEDNQNFFSQIASGSYEVDGMVVVPCSMGSLAKIAHGTSDHLLARAADVCLKEGRPLLLVPRESPLSAIHLENMLKLSRLGVRILPPMPPLYNKPTTIEDLIAMSVGRILHTMGLKNDQHITWEA